jgi:SPP1 gp7 family putative phage head morphogenesis protein
MSIDQIIEILGVWNELVGKDTVEPSDTDEDHIRQLLEMPEKGEPLPRRQPPVAGNPFQQPDPDANPTNQPNQNAEDRQTPDDVVAAWDRAAWKVSFTRALKRVRFQVIDRKSQDQVEQTVVRLRNDIANAMEDIFVMIEEGGFGGEDTAIEGVSEIKFTPAHKKKIKNTCNNVLTKSWKLGMNHADSEMKAAAKVAASREDWDRQKFAIIPGSGFLEVFPFDLERRAAEYLTETSFGMSASITKDIEKLIENVMLNGIKFSWSTEKIVQVIIEKLISKGFQTVEDWVSSDHQKKTPDEMDEALEGLGINADRLRTTVRTSYFDIVNEARFAYFNDPALGDFVQAMEYSAILDSRTTNICRHLDGKIFSKDSELWNEYRPPNHFNCRSILVAVTADDVWEESRPPTIDPQSGFGS